MKKNIFTIFTLLAFSCIISSCTSQEEDLGSYAEKDLLVLHATNSASTKMDITDPEDGTLSVLWSENEQIKVMNYTTSSDPVIFTATEVDGHSATFKGDLKINKGEYITAIYPSTLDIEDSSISVDLSNQEGTLEYVSKNSIALASGCYDSGGELDLSFDNKLAVIRIPVFLKLTSAPVALAISGADDSNKLIVSATLKTSDLNTWNENSYGKIVVPLTELGETPTLYVLMFPQSTTLEFTLTDADGEVIWSKQASVNLSAGSFYTLSAASNNISFADENVKALCVANWDTDGDGELSYAEAAAVTDLGEVFKSNADITSFDELQYFTGLKTISVYAFHSCNSLQSIMIPDSVTSIGTGAFGWCESLEKITIPDSVTEIGSRVFSHCTSLQSIAIPGSVKTIGDNAFNMCSSLQSVTIHEGVEEIGFAAFFYCTSLESVAIEGVKTIGKQAFQGCSSLKNLVIYEGVQTIGKSAFEGCTSLGDVVIPEGVTTIGEKTFNDSSIKSISLPSTLTSLGDYAFCGCASLTNLVIPEGITSLGAYAIAHCTSLTSITLPSTLTSIDHYAFYCCTALSTIYCDATTPPTCQPTAFLSCTALTAIYVPSGSVDTYKSADVWRATQITQR